MKNLIYLLFFLVSFSAFSQESGAFKIDTLYYNEKNQGVPHPAFASYYRIALIPTDSTLSKIYRDFSLNGNKLLAEGEFISLDRKNDNNSIFEGENLIYDPNTGKVIKKMFFQNGKLEGKYLEYFPNGEIKITTNYLNGKLHGVYREYTEEADYIYQSEWENGEYKYPYYYLFNKYRDTSKYSVIDDTQIFERVNSDRDLQIVSSENGSTFYKYKKNGLTIVADMEDIRQYGRYFKILLVIANRSKYPVHFHAIPQAFMRNNLREDSKLKPLKAFTAEEYDKRIITRQNWSQALLATTLTFSAASSAMAAGTSTSTTNTYISGNSNTYGNAYARSNNNYATAQFNANQNYNAYITSTTTTYNPAVSQIVAQVNGFAAGMALSDYADRLESNRQTIDAGYLTDRIILPGELISGYVLIKYTDGAELNCGFNIENVIYPFRWRSGRTMDGFPIW